MLCRKRLKNCLIFLVLISFATVQAAPHIQKVNQGDPSPFAGWCLSNAAMAKIIADKEQEVDRCQLRINEQVDKLQAKYHLEVGRLDLRIQSLEDELDETVKIKNEEIDKLEKLALDRPNNYWYLFTAGGFVVGATSVLGIWMLVGR